MIAAAERGVSVESEIDGLVGISSLIYDVLSEDAGPSVGLRRAVRESRDARVPWETEAGMDRLQELLGEAPNSDAVERAFLEMAATLNEGGDPEKIKWVQANDDLIIEAARLHGSERSLSPARAALENAGMIAQGIISESHQSRVAWPPTLAIDVLHAAAQSGLFSPEDHPEALWALVKQAGGGPDHVWSVYRAMGWRGYSKNMVADVSGANAYDALLALRAITACASSGIEGSGPERGGEGWAGMVEVWRGANAASLLGMMHPDVEVRKFASRVGLSIRGDFNAEAAKALDAELLPDVLGLIH